VSFFTNFVIKPTVCIKISQKRSLPTTEQAKKEASGHRDEKKANQKVIYDARQSRTVAQSEHNFFSVV
jgi:hypothetical protein